MSLLPEISQASAEINKLVAQANIHQTIAPVDPAAFTDPADTMLLASRDPVIREVSVGMTGVEAAPYTVSGTPPLSLHNSLGKPLKAWSVDVLPYQEGSGDPSPSNVRPIHGTDKVTITTAGKNLLDFNCITQYGVTGTKVNGVAHIAGTATLTAYPINFVATEYPAGTYVWSISELPTGVQCQYTKNGAWAGYVTQGATLTLSESATIGGYVNIATGTTVDTVIQIQLEFGSTASTFTPYIAPSQTVLTLPQTVYTGTIGSEGGESRDAMVDMGDMTWDGVGSAGRFYSSSIRTLVKAGSDADGYDNAFAETYKAQNVASLSFLSDYCMSVDTSGNVQLYDSSKAGMTGAELKTALSGIKMVYKLATPVQFALSAPTIPTPTGTATTWATAEDGTVDGMEVTYVGEA